MHAVKRLFGVMMIGLAIWVVQPVVPVALQLAAWGLLLLLLGFMLQPFGAKPSHHHVLRNGLTRALGVGALAMGVMQLVGAASGGSDPLQPLAHLGEPARAGHAPDRSSSSQSVFWAFSDLAPRPRRPAPWSRIRSAIAPGPSARVSPPRNWMRPSSSCRSPCTRGWDPAWT